MLDIEISHMDTEYKESITAEEVANYFIKHLESNPLIWKKDKKEWFVWNFGINRETDFHYASLLDIVFDSYDRSSYFYWWLLDKEERDAMNDTDKCKELFKEWVKEIFEEERLTFTE